MCGVQLPSTATLTVGTGGQRLPCRPPDPLLCAAVELGLTQTAERQSAIQAQSGLREGWRGSVCQPHRTKAWEKDCRAAK